MPKNGTALPFQRELLVKPLQELLDRDHEERPGEAGDQRQAVEGRIDRQAESVEPGLPEENAENAGSEGPVGFAEAQAQSERDRPATQAAEPGDLEKWAEVVQ
jgi:hypothetical protein